VWGQGASRVQAKTAATVHQAISMSARSGLRRKPDISAL
jgi:hypothetical protein